MGEGRDRVCAYARNKELFVRPGHSRPSIQSVWPTVERVHNIAVSGRAPRNETVAKYPPERGGSKERKFVPLFCARIDLNHRELNIFLSIFARKRVRVAPPPGGDLYTFRYKKYFHA